MRLLNAQAAMTDKSNAVFASSISTWEIILKFRSGKERGFAKLAADMFGEQPLDCSGTGRGYDDNINRLQRLALRRQIAVVDQ